MKPGCAISNQYDILLTAIVLFLFLGGGGVAYKHDFFISKTAIVDVRNGKLTCHTKVSAKHPLNQVIRQQVCSNETCCTKVATISFMSMAKSNCGVKIM